MAMGMATAMIAHTVLAALALAVADTLAER